MIALCRRLIVNNGVNGQRLQLLASVSYYLSWIVWSLSSLSKNDLNKKVKDLRNMTESISVQWDKLCHHIPNASNVNVKPNQCGYHTQQKKILNPPPTRFQGWVINRISISITIWACHNHKNKINNVKQLLHDMRQREGKWHVCAVHLGSGMAAELICCNSSQCVLLCWMQLCWAPNSIKALAIWRPPQQKPRNSADRIFGWTGSQYKN